MKFLKSLLLKVVVSSVIICLLILYFTISAIVCSPCIILGSFKYAFVISSEEKKQWLKSCGSFKEKRFWWIMDFLEYAQDEGDIYLSLYIWRIHLRSTT